MAKFARGVAMGGAAAVAASLVSRETVRSRSRMAAYRAIGTKLGMSGAWVRRLVAGGVKSIDAAVRDRLHALLIRELEAEIARLTHELEIARRCGAHLAALHISEIETHLAAAHALLNGGDNREAPDGQDKN